MTFTDEQLAPTRTTRQNWDPVRDILEVAKGDELLVDTSAYRGTRSDSVRWCKVIGMAPGSAAVFPYRVKIPDRGTGQYAAREILAWRRPLELHRVLVEVRELHFDHVDVTAIEPSASTAGWQELLESLEGQQA